MRFIKNLRYPMIGWIAGAVMIFVLVWSWALIFPGIVPTKHYDATDPGFRLILGIALLAASPAALIGGLMGSRLPREGGQTEQMIAAALIGAILTVPFGCISLWLLIGS